MTQITFIEPGGRAVAVQVPAGGSVMEAAVASDIDGIDALCGGACACGTCHVYVRSPWLARLGVPDAQEADLLAQSGVQTPASRLACQITVSPDLEGLTVEVAPRAP